MHLFASCRSLLVFAFSFCLLTTAFLPSFALPPRLVRKPGTRYDVIQVLPHDNTCFTQGLEIFSSDLYLESCGLYGESRVQLVEFPKNHSNFSRSPPDALALPSLTPLDALLGRNLPEVPVVLAVTRAPANVFLEGLTVYNKKTVFVLTWREHLILEYRLPNLDFVQSHAYPFEGWGIANHLLSVANNKEQGEGEGEGEGESWEQNEVSIRSSNVFYTTDGSSTIRKLKYVPSEGFSVEDELLVANCFGFGRPAQRLNEIEFVPPKYLFMNIWLSDHVLIYDVDAKQCVEFMDLSSLPDPAKTRSHVLNGIAAYRDRRRCESGGERGAESGVRRGRSFDDTCSHLLVTGKKWANMFLVKHTLAAAL